jgi:mRNA interferase RelE/StbE
LAGRDGWRIRIGQYRVIYEIENAIRVVTVLDVGHRRDIYR